MSNIALQRRVFRQISNDGKANDFTFDVPAGHYIRDIIIVNNTANAVTGGLKFGTTAGGTDVVSSVAVGANATTFVADSALAKRLFSKTAIQTIYVADVTAWNSANVDVTVIIGRF